MKKLCIFLVLLTLVYNSPLLALASTISDVNSFESNIHVTENMTPTIDFRTERPRLVDINYLNVYETTPNDTLLNEISTYLRKPLIDKAIDEQISLTQQVSNDFILNYIKNLNWRVATERYFVYQNNNLASDFSSQENFKKLQNYCEENQIKLAVISSETNKDTISTTLKTLSNSYFFSLDNNTTIQSILTKLAQIITNEKVADIFINVGSSNYTDIQIQEAIESELRAKLLNNNITANINVNRGYEISSYKLKYFSQLPDNPDKGFALNEKGDLYFWIIERTADNTDAVIKSYLIDQEVKYIGYYIGYDVDARYKNGKWSYEYFNKLGDFYKLKNNGELYIQNVDIPYYINHEIFVRDGIDTMGGGGYFRNQVIDWFGTTRSTHYSIQIDCLPSHPDYSYDNNTPYGKLKSGGIYYFEPDLHYRERSDFKIFIPSISQGLRDKPSNSVTPREYGVGQISFYVDSSGNPYAFTYRIDQGRYTSTQPVKGIGLDGIVRDIKIIDFIENDGKYYLIDNNNRYYTFGYKYKSGDAQHFIDERNGEWLRIDNYKLANMYSYDTYIINQYKNDAEDYHIYCANEIPIPALKSEFPITDESIKGNIKIYEQGYTNSWGGDNWKEVSIKPDQSSFGSNTTTSTILNYISNISSNSSNVFITDITNTLRTDNLDICSSVLQKLDGHFIGINNNDSKPFTLQLIEKNNKGIYINDSDINTAMSQLADYIIANTKKTEKSSYVLLNEQIDYIKDYNDPELDICFEETWNFTHDYNYFTNSLGIIVDTEGIYTGVVNGQLDGIDIKIPIFSFDKVGKFHVGLRAKDNPNPPRTEISRFGEWTYQDIIVNRRPIAKFSYTATFDDSSGKYIPTFVDNSYDLDHSNLSSKGIVNWLWKYRLSSDIAWTIGKPTFLDTASNYDISLEVLDLEGYWSYPQIVTISTEDIPPNIIANPTTVEMSENPISVNLFATDTESKLKNLKWSITESPVKPNSFTNSTSNFTGTKISHTQSVLLDADGTWYINAEAEDQAGNKTYKAFGPYTLQMMNIYDFTVTTIYQTDWRPYFADMNNPHDIDGDGITDYDRSGKEIKTLCMPINYYNFPTIGSNLPDSVKAGVETDGYIRLSNVPDSGKLIATYTTNTNETKTVDIPLVPSDSNKYKWVFVIPQDAKQESFISFSVSVKKGSRTYGNEKWNDTWDARNTNKSVFFVKGDVLNSIRFHQTH